MLRSPRKAFARPGAAALSIAAGLVLLVPAVPASAAPVYTHVEQPRPISVGSSLISRRNQERQISVPAWGTGSSGPASVFPSTIQVASDAVVVDVDVELDIQHERLEDLQVRLVAPDGTSVTLLADAGGDSSQFGTLILDDEAPAPIPDDGPASSGRFQPSVYGGSVTDLKSLSALAGAPARGAWKLYVSDTHDGNVGVLSQWRLDLRLSTAPYPSEVTVSGAGAVTDVNLNLDGLTSGYLPDLDLMLGGPRGQQAMVLSDAGGQSPVDDVDLTLDDEAAQHLPASGAWYSGPFQPTDIDEVGMPDSMPAPAPAPDGNAALSVFDGTDPNGVWRLFAVDDWQGDLTELDGWSLDIESDDSASPSGSVVVAAGAASTRTAQVAVHLQATDPSPGTGVTQVRLTDAAGHWGPYQPFTPDLPLALSGPDGLRTVQAQFKDAAGNESTVVSDTIVLDRVAPSVLRVRPRSRIKIRFSERLDPATITRHTVYLRRGPVIVLARLHYLDAGHLVLLTPLRPLRPGDYALIVLPRVTDVAGNGYDALPAPGHQRLRYRFTVPERATR